MQDTRDIAAKIKTLAAAHQTRFNCKVFVSEMTPRGDLYNGHNNTINKARFIKQYGNKD